jgi:hypothetical protein
LIAVVIPLAEVAIGFFPGVAHATQETVTVIDWFTLFQTHWFLGLRNLGLLNLVGAALLAPTILAIYFAIRRDHEAYGVLGTILFFVWLAVYVARFQQLLRPERPSMRGNPGKRRGIESLPQFGQGMSRRPPTA